MEKRYFSIVDFPERGQRFGKYSATYPAQAAYKAFNKLAKQMKFQDSKTGKYYITFNLEDINTNKLYKYIGTLIKLDKDVNISIKNKSFTVHNRPIVTKYDKSMDNIFTIVS